MDSHNMIKIYLQYVKYPWQKLCMYAYLKSFSIAFFNTKSLLQNLHNWVIFDSRRIIYKWILSLQTPIRHHNFWSKIYRHLNIISFVAYFKCKHSTTNKPLEQQLTLVVGIFHMVLKGKLAFNVSFVLQMWCNMKAY